MGKFKTSSIGLDIGTRFIKFVELKKSGDGITFNKFGIKEIQAGAESGRDKIVYQLVSQLLAENNIKSRDVTISAGGQSVFVRFVKLLNTKEEKLSQTMKFEAQNQIPFPLEQVSWDWSLLDRENKASRKAVIVAIKKNIIEEMMTMLKAVKLSTDLIDVSPVSLYNCVAFNEDYEDGRLGAIVDIGSAVTNLVMFKQGNIWIRSFPIAGERILQDREQGIAELIGEIERSIEYYFMQAGEETQGEKKLDELMLTGGGSVIEGVQAALASKFETRQRTLDPFRKLKISKDVFSKIQSESVKSQLSVAVGLALRHLTGLKIEVNFLKQDISEKYSARQKNLYLRLSIALAILIAASFSFLTRKGYSIKRAKLERIEEMLDIYRTYEPKIKKIQESEDALRDKINILYQTAASRGLWLDVMKAISGILPKEVWITDVSGIVSLEKSGLGKLDLSGKALSYQAVNTFVSSLKSSPDFKDVKPISSSIEADENTGEEIVKFSITMDVVVSGD